MVAFDIVPVACEDPSQLVKDHRRREVYFGASVVVIRSSQASSNNQCDAMLIALKRSLSAVLPRLPIVSQLILSI